MNPLRVVPRPLCVAALFALALTAPRVAWSHGGVTSRVPFEVCEGEALGAACEWDNGHGALSIGTCRGVDTLRCVRNRPLVQVDPTTADHDHAHESPVHDASGSADHDHAHDPPHQAAPGSAAEASSRWQWFWAFPIVAVAAAFARRARMKSA